MRIAIAALGLLGLTMSAALAAQADGTIESVDATALTITLDDGKTYKLPPEIDMDGIKVGISVVIAYDKVGGQNQITDMDFPE